MWGWKKKTKISNGTLFPDEPREKVQLGDMGGVSRARSREPSGGNLWDGAGGAWLLGKAACPTLDFLILSKEERKLAGEN